MNKDYISIGKILNFHGIKGEAKVGYTKGNDKFLSSLEFVYLKQGNSFVQLTIETLRFHKQFALIKFKEINSVNEIQELKGQNIFVQKQTAQNSLKDNEYLFSDLEGAKVYNQYDDFVGTIDRIGETQAGNILSVVMPSGKTVLIPFVEEIVPIVDVKNKKVLIKEIEGLIDD